MAKSEKGRRPPSPQEREVRIYSLATTANECIIFLEEMTGNRLLPIWIGITEGQAIAIRFSGIVLPRPLTHDLLLSTSTTLGYAVQKVVVCDIKDNTFYARIRVAKDGTAPLDIDSRPSDAIAVAVRAGCPIFVEEKVFLNCQTLAKPITEDEVSKFKADLKNLKPEDIFKDLQSQSGKKPSKEPKAPEDKNEKSEGEDKQDE
ncbi:MAG: bifunctional nuclease family protein [Elusimicrobia bacterium]|nr:bifunctional nuclease family protein [Elusimicrobiota bacterium]